jgi:hypothetical protein
LLGGLLRLSAVRWMVHMRVHAIPTLSNHQDPLAVLACCLEAVKDAVFNSARDLALTDIAVGVHSQFEVGIRLTKAFGFYPV